MLILSIVTYKLMRSYLDYKDYSKMTYDYLRKNFDKKLNFLNEK